MVVLALFRVCLHHVDTAGGRGRAAARSQGGEQLSGLEARELTTQGTEIVVAAEPMPATVTHAERRAECRLGSGARGSRGGTDGRKRRRRSDPVSSAGRSGRRPSLLDEPYLTNFPVRLSSLKVVRSWVPVNNSNTGRSLGTTKQMWGAG